MRAVAPGIAIVLAASCLAGAAGAVDVEKLVMPGAVIEGHADIESQCAKCHERFDSGAQRRLCLECHEDVAADVAAKQGFHGRALAPEAECRSCHGEHRGRAADVRALTRETFDHDLTDYPLRGAHPRVACEACHPAGVERREAPAQCVACHREDEPHAGKLGERCDDCHNESGWRESKFDHDKTDFALRGAHDSVTCGACHPGQRYEGTPSACVDCHRIDDTHRGRRGADCARCHGVDSWKSKRFDHVRESGFQLTGSHAKAACQACHRSGNFEEKLGHACSDCHAREDVHKGTFGRGCEGCHGTAAWEKPTFDHDAVSGYALVGHHREAACETCHRKPVAEARLRDDCIACHRDDDVHRGQEGSACERCHDSRGWRVEVRFDHDATRFPLLAMHAVASCESCHRTPAFQDAERECRACHAADDTHEGRLGRRCEQCHNPGGWAWWSFDHDAGTSFALRGAHAGLECRACHRTATPDPGALDKACVACHAKQDPHRGRFGARCEACHGESSWKERTR